MANSDIVPNKVNLGKQGHEEDHLQSSDQQKDLKVEKKDLSKDKITKNGAKKQSITQESVAAPKSIKRKKVKRLVVDAIVHICATFNNTIISISDLQGNVITWATSRHCGYSGSRKSTAFAAGEAAQVAGRAAMEKFGTKKVMVRVSGPGQGRESAVRALHTIGLEILLISDATGIPHNGCRDRKKRRA